MTNEEIEASNRHYAGNLGTLEEPAHVCDWGSPLSQRARFQVLAAVGNLEGCSLLDVGCGLGGFLEWLQEKGIRVRYTGYDLCPEMVSAASRRHPEASFVVKNLLEDGDGQAFDYVIASGIFNRAYSDNQGFIRAMLSAFHVRSKIGFATNFITTWADSSAIGRETYQVDPYWLLETAKEFSPRIAFRHDYLPHDGTLFVYHEPCR